MPFQLLELVLQRRFIGPRTLSQCAPNPGYIGTLFCTYKKQVCMFICYHFLDVSIQKVDACITLFNPLFSSPRFLWVLSQSKQITFLSQWSAVSPTCIVCIYRSSMGEFRLFRFVLLRFKPELKRYRLVSDFPKEGRHIFWLSEKISSLR